jgi:putative membrane protein
VRRRTAATAGSLPPVTPRPLVLTVNAARGALIGAAEVVPGVSGGTVALVVGVYERLVASAGHFLSAVRLLLRDLPRGKGTAAGRTELRHVDWSTAVPVVVGMMLTVVTLARVIEPLLEEHPERARALFLGLVLSSIVVPAAMVGKWGRRELALAASAAAAAVVLTSLPPASSSSPPMLFVYAAAALAVCALVLPGVSGSFLLLSVGVYEPTLAAVNGRDLPYLATFVAGALTGVVLFVKVLQYLLASHRKATLAVMTGLMTGSLRALWPWQTEDRSLLAPSDQVGPVIGFVLLGVVIVGTLLVLEARSLRVGTFEAARRLGQDPLTDDDPFDGTPADQEPSAGTTRAEQTARNAPGAG